MQGDDRSGHPSLSANIIPRYCVCCCRYLDIKHHGKAEEMREQELLRAQMSLAYRTGDQTKAAQIMERLKPDEIKEREAARRLDPEPPN